jgi:hypothetical protein
MMKIINDQVHFSEKEANQQAKTTLLHAMNGSFIEIKWHDRSSYNQLSPILLYRSYLLKQNEQ